MSVFARFSVATVLLLGVAGCAVAPSPDLATGAAAYDLMPAPVPGRGNVAPTYVIGSDDVLNVQVFQEPDLSNDKLKVDANGNVGLPLIGQVPAAGLTAPQLSQAIAASLGQRYLVNPQVVVNVTDPAPHFFTIEGQIKAPGVYEIADDYTLLSAVARAQSTTPIAKLDEVIIFREIGDKRLGAIFNLKDIRKGLAPDPKLIPGDKIVVGFSAVKGAYRDFLQTIPLISVFTQF